jgi:hypothetical protein
MVQALRAEGREINRKRLCDELSADSTRPVKAAFAEASFWAKSWD